MQISAVILDLDGTIIDSEQYWIKSFNDVARKLSLEVNLTKKGTGFSVKSNWQKIIDQNKLQISKNTDELTALTLLEFEKYIPQINLNEGVAEFMEGLAESNVLIALASSTNWTIVEKVLNQFQIEHFFESITTGDEVANPKPDPEIYLTSANKMNLDADQCLVIEDSEPGILAAKEAGMKVVAIDADEENGFLDEADTVVGSFYEITPKLIDSL